MEAAEGGTGRLASGRQLGREGEREGGHLEEWSVFLVLGWLSLDTFNLSQNPALLLKELETG